VTSSQILKDFLGNIIKEYDDTHRRRMPKQVLKADQEIDPNFTTSNLYFQVQQLTNHKAIMTLDDSCIFTNQLIAKADKLQNMEKILIKELKRRLVLLYELND